MPLVPSIASDQTPPSQVPQYSNSGLGLRSVAAMLDRDPGHVAQNKIVYPASRTTLYHQIELPSCAVAIEVTKQLTKSSASSPVVRMRGALLSRGSTLFVERCQEFDSSPVPGAAAPCVTRWTRSADPRPCGSSLRGVPTLTITLHGGRRITAHAGRRPLQAPPVARLETAGIRAPPKLGQAAGNSVPTRKLKSIPPGSNPSKRHRADWRMIVPSDQEPSRAVQPQASRPAVGRCEPSIGGNEHGQQRDET